ncbi:MAG TPA: Ldh family oxidoreductase [Usitatibacteraceae bacterium]|nr:Ldh family oxidoreductase [Usitatibacteraceae bacterium]HRA22010.1 Ldh family oxidoreductase [Usitatibacteraceae bacterium]
MRFYDTTALSDWLAGAFAACGMAPDAARAGARVLVRTNARGVETHGVSRALVYVQKLRSGELAPRPEVRYEDRDGVLHCHAGCGLGQAVAPQVIDEAVSRAGRAGFVPVIIHDVGHLAAIGMFALQAAEAGMIAFIAQSTPPIMALPGSTRAAIGNNPLAFASPVAGGPPLVFDIAASGVARGNVLAAAREQREIPLGWAIDAEGRPTTDPKAALSGAMLPMAGHKGIGLAMMVQCLAGSLSGALPASVTGAAPGSAPSRVGAFLFVANPDLVAGRAAYDAHMAGWLEAYRQASGPDGRYPGERAARLEAERATTGIPLPEGVVNELRTVGETTGVPFTQEPLAQTAAA